VLATTLAVAAVAAATEMAAAFVGSAAAPIRAAAPAAAAAQSCGTLISVVCGDETRNETYGGTNSFSQSKSGSSGGTQSVSQGGGGSSHHGSSLATPDIRQTTASVNAGNIGSSEVDCLPGEVVTGGGYSLPTGSNLQVTGSFPKTSGAQGWVVTVANTTGTSTQSYTTYAICVPTS